MTEEERKRVAELRRIMPLHHWILWRARGWKPFNQFLGWLYNMGLLPKFKDKRICFICKRKMGKHTLAQVQDCYRVYCIGCGMPTQEQQTRDELIRNTGWPGVQFTREELPRICPCGKVWGEHIVNEYYVCGERFPLFPQRNYRVTA